jgi:outer membrane murein-binding lipoprotein Lpp
MKKGLLSILAGALLVVGCQNYDDQFDNLESQINALASQVAGLSQVQSDLASLAGTVNSLSSTVNGLGAEIDSAVSEGLSTGLESITADIEAIESAVENVASSEEVSVLSEAVSESQEDLSELLANSSVFQNDVIISSNAQLEAFHAIGSSISIVNGKVEINSTSTMDMTKLQEVVNQIKVTIQDFSYTAGTGVTNEITFSNLTGTQSLTLNQKGGYMLENLESATVVTLTDDATTDIVHLGKLASVTSINGGSLVFPKATELHLSSLPRYGSALTLEVADGGVIDMPLLRDVDAAGTQSALALSITGPASVTISELDGKGGSLTFTDVPTVTVNSYDGSITIGNNVKNFSSDGAVTLTMTAADDLETFNVTGKLDPNATPADTAGPEITLNNLDDLTSATISGDIGKVVVEENNNLKSLTIDAKVTGADGIDIDDNSDLASITLTGSSAARVDVTDNNDLVTLTVDTAIIASSATGAKVDGRVQVSSNESLLDLTISSTPLNFLEIYSNSDLETIDLSGVKAIGASGAPSVDIYENKLIATKAENLTDGTTDVADGQAGDLGAFTTTSGMETAVEYLTAVASDTTATADVKFDKVDLLVNSEGTTATETADETDFVVLSMTPAVAEVRTGDNAAVAGKIAYLVGSPSYASLEMSGVEIFHDGTDYAPVSLTGNIDVDLIALKSDLALSRATTLGLTLDVVKGGADGVDIVFASSIAATDNGEYYTDDEARALTSGTISTFITSKDVFKLSYGSYTVTASISASSATGSAAAEAVRYALGLKWSTTYGGGASSSTIWGGFNSTPAPGDDAKTLEGLALQSTGTGSRGVNDQIKIEWTAATAAQVSEATSGATTQTTIMSWTIGDSDSTADNYTVGTDLVVTLADNDALVNDVASTLVSTNLTTLTSSAYTYPSPGINQASATDVYPLEARNDVINAENSNEGTITTTGVPASSVSRIGWLSSGS